MISSRLSFKVNSSWWDRHQTKTNHGTTASHNVTASPFLKPLFTLAPSLSKNTMLFATVTYI